MKSQRTACDPRIKWVSFLWTLLLVGLLDGALVPVYGAPPVMTITRDPDKYPEPFILYAKGLFEPVYPSTVPTPPESISKVDVTASRGELASTTFSIYAFETYDRVRLDASELSSGRHTILSSNVDLRVVYVWQVPHWQRSGLRKGLKLVRLTPEMLLKDNRINLKQIQADMKEDIYPPLLAHDHVLADVQSNQSTQFWLRIKVPPATPPGDYRGHIRIRFSPELTHELPVRLRVLPIVLQEPGDKHYIMSYRQVLEPGNAYNTIDQQQMRAQLQDIKEAGFNGTTIYDHSSLEAIKKAYQLRTEAGLAEHTILVGARKYFTRHPDQMGELVEAMQEFCQHANLPEPYYFTIDEPPRSGPKHDELVKTSKAVRSAGGKTFTYFYHATRGITDWLDAGAMTSYSYNFPMLRVRDLFHEQNKPVYYYYQIGHPAPVINRMLAGFFLITSGYDGIVPFCYQDRRPGEKIYDPTSTSSAYNQVVYPARDRVVSTLQWEATRAGIDDVRYWDRAIEAWKQLSDSAPREQRPALEQLRQRIDARLSKYGFENPFWAASKYWDDHAFPKRDNAIAGSRFIEDRTYLADLTVTLTAMQTQSQFPPPQSDSRPVICRPHHVWTHQLETAGAAWSPPIVLPNGDLAYTARAMLYCVDPTGRRRWAIDLEKQQVSQPTGDDQGHLYLLVGPPAELVSIDGAGEIRWRVKLGGRRPAGDLTVANNTVIVAEGQTKSASAWSSDGNRLWRWRAINDEPVKHVTVGPAGITYATTIQKLFAIRNGETLWEVPFAKGGTPAVDAASNLYVPVTNRFVSYLPKNSAYVAPLRRWENGSFAYFRQSNQPVISSYGMVLVGTCDGLMGAYSTLDGSRLWAYRCAHEIRQPVVLLDGKAAYFVTEGGNLVAVDFEGNTLWEQEFPGHHLKGPAVDGHGRLYVTLEDGSLLCMAEVDGETITKSKKLPTNGTTTDD